MRKAFFSLAFSTRWLFGILPFSFHLKEKICLNSLRIHIKQSSLSVREANFPYALFTMCICHNGALCTFTFMRIESRTCTIAKCWNALIHTQSNTVECRQVAGKIVCTCIAARICSFYGASTCIYSYFRGLGASTYIYTSLNTSRQTSETNAPQFLNKKKEIYLKRTNC